MLDRKDLASYEFRPPWSASNERSFTTFELEKEFVNKQAGGNFSFGLGLGVAVLVEPRGGDLVATNEQLLSQRGSIRIGQVRLEFDAKPRQDDVQV